jgi:hypothetical protein
MFVFATLNYIGNVIAWAAIFAGSDMLSASPIIFVAIVNGSAMLEYLLSDLILVRRTSHVHDACISYSTALSIVENLGSEIFRHCFPNTDVSHLSR